MYSLNYLKEIFSNDLEAYNESLKLLKGELSESIEFLNTGIKEQNVAMIKATFHKLKATLGPIKAEEILAQINDCKNGTTLSEYLKKAELVLDKIIAIYSSIQCP